MRIPCYLDFDEHSSTVTIVHAKTGCTQLKIKLEKSSSGTMKRVVPDEDCDNYWIAVKPADSVVFEDRLFGDKSVIVDRFDFRLEK